MPSVSLPHTITAGQPAAAAQVQANFAALRDGINTQTFALELGHTFAVGGEVRVPVGQVDVIPGLYVPVLANQTVKLKRVRYAITAGTSATVKVQRNAVDITGLTGLAATSTVAETSPSGGPVTLANNDKFQVIVTAVSATPQNMTVTLVFEHALVV